MYVLERDMCLHLRDICITEGGERKRERDVSTLEKRVCIREMTVPSGTCVREMSILEVREMTILESAPSPQ